jgi:hypothetical protein
MMFLGFSLVYYWRFKCNTHNNYNQLIKTKWSYLLEIIYNREKKHQAS